MRLCKYLELLGKPGEGIHSIRIFNIAIVDVIITLIVAKCSQYIFRTVFPYPYWVWLIATLVSGIVIHRVFCVNTTINKMIFGVISAKLD